MVGDGFRVHNFFPSQPGIGLEGMSPFFLMDYNSFQTLPPSPRPKGVGVHPHRGIETVTLAYHGRIAHHDSAGNSGIIGEGDVQWMTAGGGVLHKEYHEKEFSSKGGPFQMVQLWVNLPAKYKMTPAKYQSLEKSQMTRFVSPDGKYSIDIIAGEYKGLKGPAQTFSPVSLMNLNMIEGSEATFAFPASYNSGFLVVEGEVITNEDKVVLQNHFVQFGKSGEDFLIKALKNSIILVLAGEPLNEPVFPHGPFVMNSEKEINQAWEDYHNGKFGYLED